MTKFLETGGRPVTLLDGDLVRKHLSSELGFSKKHRDINIHEGGQSPQYWRHFVFVANLLLDCEGLMTVM